MGEIKIPPAPLTGTKLVESINKGFDKLYQANRDNYIINSSFKVWQRGTSFEIGDYYAFNKYTADRYKANLAKVTRQEFSVTQKDVPGYPEYFMSVSALATPRTWSHVGQEIENVRLIAGKTVVLSFYAKSAIGSNVYIQHGYYYGKDNETNQGYEFFEEPIKLTSDWKRYFKVIQFPEIIATKITESNYVFVNFYGAKDVAINYQFDLANIKLEDGEIATPYKELPYDLELFDCYRYFQKINASNAQCGDISLGTVYYDSAAGNGVCFYPLQFLRPMRAIPSASYDGTNAAYTINVGISSYRVGTINFLNESNAGALVKCNVLSYPNDTSPKPCVIVQTPNGRPWGWQLDAEYGEEN